MATQAWASFMQDLRGLNDFLEESKPLLDKTSMKKLLDKHIVNITNRVVRCTGPEAAEFMRFIGSQSLWSDDHKETLNGWINQALLSGSSGDTLQGSPKRNGQEIQSFAMYFSEKDVGCLSNAEIPSHVKLQCVSLALCKGVSCSCLSYTYVTVLSSVCAVAPAHSS